MANDPRIAAQQAEAAAEAARVAAAEAAQQAAIDEAGGEGTATATTRGEPSAVTLAETTTATVLDQTEAAGAGDGQLDAMAMSSLLDREASLLGQGGRDPMLALPQLATTMPGGGGEFEAPFDLTFDDGGPAIGKDAMALRVSDGVSADEVNDAGDVGEVLWKTLGTAPYRMIGRTTIGSYTFNERKTSGTTTGGSQNPGSSDGAVGGDADTWSDGDGIRSNDGAPIISTGIDAQEVTEFFEGLFGSHAVSNSEAAGAAGGESATGESAGASGVAQPAPDDTGAYTGSWSGVTPIAPGSGDDDLVAGVTGHGGKTGSEAVNPGSEGTMYDVGRETDLRDAKQWYGGVAQPAPDLEVANENPEMLDQGISIVDPNTVNPSRGDGSTSDAGAQASTAYRYAATDGVPDEPDAFPPMEDESEPRLGHGRDAGHDQGRGHAQGHGHGRTDNDADDDAAGA